MRLPQLSLLSRVALSLAAVGLLPLAISSFGLVDINRDALYEQVLRTHMVAAQTAAVRVSAALATWASLARSAASNPALAEPHSPAAQSFLAESLGAWADLGVLAVEVADPAGEKVVQAQLHGVQGRVESALALRPPAALEAVAGEELTVRVAAPLPQNVGLVRLVCGGAGLADALASDIVGEAADLVLADRGGRVLLGRTESLAGLPEGLVKMALSGRVLGAGRFRTGDGAEILGAWSPVPDSDWVVISRQPAHVAEAVAVRLRRRSAAAIGAALALIGGLSFVAWRGLVRPIRELVGGAAPALAGSPGGNEIHALRRAFEALERSVSDRRSLVDVFLGRYQVIEPLGTGAMGSVFRGWDPKLQRPVALKTVRLEAAVDPVKRKQLVETLLREAVRLARLSHPNVVPVYDVEDSPEGAFVAMELVDGVNLEALLWSHGRLGPPRVVPLGAAIARALEAAHGHGIIHRDIKPSNILLGWDGSIKVSDFGIAELVATAESDTMVVGTPGYVPPETLERGSYGPSGDLFALGVVLYRSLRSVHPFAGGTLPEVVRATLLREIPPLSRVVPGLPPGLEELILRLLAKDPEARPGNAGAVAAELEALASAYRYRWALDLTRESLAAAAEETRPNIGSAGGVADGAGSPTLLLTRMRRQKG